jgi:hypothetical protein|tara:strand:- start:180 stop:1055 length:876 start_codon:yes stop_codon:yes gene_type:complete
MKVIDKLDNSMMMEFASCPRKFYYRYALNLTSKDGSAIFKPEFGSALHSALEVHYLGEGEQKAIEAFVKHWMPYEGHDVKNIRSCAKGIKIVEEYIKTFPFESEHFEVVEKKDVELAGAIDMGNFLFLFRADLLVRDKNNGSYKVLDHKTTAYKGFLTPKPNQQLCGYAYALGEQTGEKIETAILNILHFTKLQINFMREEISFPTDYIQHEWVKDVRLWAETIANSCRIDHFPKNTGQCTAYGGCQFIHLCKHKQGSPTHTTLLDSLYTEHKWEPYVGARDDLKKEETSC